jgi:2-dehydro-3-deoxyphosphooctonate aldolase (KDO 8-P synthase)
MRLAGADVGQHAPLFLIAGPCVIESEALVLDVATQLQAVAAKLGMPFVFKASFDKANRSSLRGFRGLGIERGLRALERVRAEVGVPVLTDVHEDTPLDEVAAVVDVLQTPALLCRQTDFILSVARCGKPVNLKKGQFLSPTEMCNVVDKARSTGNDNLLVCERGVIFGYNDLVADMRSLAILRGTGCPVVFDATHSVQRPGARGSESGGDRRHVPVLARAAVAAGVAGVFLETHPRPDAALSDASTSWPLELVGPLLEQLQEIDAVVKAQPYLENDDRLNETPSQAKTQPLILREYS